MNRTAYLSALIIALAVTAAPAWAAPGDPSPVTSLDTQTAQTALKAAEKAILMGNDKEATHQLKTYRKAMKAIRIRRQIKKAMESMESITDA